MNLLLDTHALLWWLGDDETLSTGAREAISNPENSVFLSAVVVWEIWIKQGVGKLNVPDDFAAVLERQRFSELSISIDHANGVAGLPSIHRDPFDRMLVAQAMIEKMTIVTRDSLFGEYGVEVLEA